MNKKTTAERRNDILNVAARLFVEKGYNETSISDIANECGLAHGTFYCYFKTKDEVFKEVVYYIPYIHTKKLSDTLCTKKSAKDKINYLCDWICEHESTENKFLEDPANLFSADISKIIGGVLRNISLLFHNLIADIYKEGVESGDFEIKNIDFTVIVTIGVFKELIGRRYFVKERLWDQKESEEYIKTFFENLLNTKL